MLVRGRVTPVCSRRMEVGTPLRLTFSLPRTTEMERSAIRASLGSRPTRAAVQSLVRYRSRLPSCCSEALLSQSQTSHGSGTRRLSRTLRRIQVTFVIAAIHAAMNSLGFRFCPQGSHSTFQQDSVPDAMIVWNGVL